MGGVPRHIKKRGGGLMARSRVEGGGGGVLGTDTTREKGGLKN